MKKIGAATIVFVAAAVLAACASAPGGEPSSIPLSDTTQQVVPRMVGGYGYGPGMMGRYGQDSPIDNGIQPGGAGFVAGSVEAPRVVHVIAGPGYIFTPETITVQRGETILFSVTTVGPLVHEFMVGPADAVAADQEGTPEVADIVMMHSKTLAYTFDSSGPYAFACHAPGHYEAGMAGTITLVG